MNRPTFCEIKNMNWLFFFCFFFSNARYMIGVGVKLLTRTTVPKLPLELSPPEASSSQIVWFSRGPRELKIGRKWSESSIIYIGLELAIDPLPTGGNFEHYDFLKQHYKDTK